MKQKNKEQVFYYNDSFDNEFATTVKEPKPLPNNYKYVNKNWLFRAISFILYYLIVKPIAYIYVKHKFKRKIIGKGALRELRGKGYFIYSNHTTLVGDAFMTHTLEYKRRNYIITGSQASSLRPILPLMKALGNIPLGQTAAQSLRMSRCIKRRIKECGTVTIYPEARVWPYYTGIRPFGEESFLYAAINRTPVIVTTTCFTKRRFRRTPRITTVISGPFYPKAEMCASENAKYLRDLAYSEMCRASKRFSTYSRYVYERA